VDKQRNIQNLALVGFMGTGKTTIGKMIAETLRFTFVDTDEMIEARTGKTIAQIFASEGEPKFRELERVVVDELADRKKCIISTGGGLPVFGDNLDQLKLHSLTVCLWSSPEKIFERVKNQTHRPLLNEPDPLAKIRALLGVREPFYRRADVLVNTELRSARELAQQIIHHFQTARAAQR
jgi:shikimate kinase